MKNISTETLLKHIAALQDVQKRNPCNSAAWQAASQRLQPLFAEMARRQGEA